MSNASRRDGQTSLAWTWAIAVWAVLALLALGPVARLLDAAFPIFTVVWIAVPLGVVARARDARRVGVRSVQGRELLRTTAICLGLSLAVMAVLEPWSHAYATLIRLATTAEPPDTTFAWLARYPRPPALAAMAAYSGLVTLFGEELFFRGWLLQTLRPCLGPARAIVVQAALFTLPNLLAAVALGPIAGSAYAVYAFVGVGLAGGWAASRTGAIWPSLATVSVENLLLVALLT